MKISQKRSNKLHRGSTRWVFLTKNYAIKFPSLHSWKNFLSGLLGNIQEIEFNKLNNEKLCPIKIYAPGGWFVVMSRCKPLTRIEYDKLIDHTWLLCYAEDDHVSFMLPVEMKLSSFGWLNGRIVALDYGS